MIAAILIGLAIVGFGFAAWTGRWRRWAAWDGPPGYNAPISFLPAIGITVIFATLAYNDYGQPVTDAIAAISWVGGLVLYLWHPRWYGPRWYRERRERDEIRLDMAVSANVLADGEQRGTLVLFRTALAFSALDGPNEILVVRSHDYLGARVEQGALVVDTQGGPLVFGLRRAVRAANRIERTLRQ